MDDMSGCRFPMQPIILDPLGTARFRQNSIVWHLVESYPGGLNALSRIAYFDQDEWRQLAQLIGYSVSGFGELSYASKDAIAKADAEADRLLAEAKEKK